MASWSHEVKRKWALKRNGKSLDRYSTFEMRFVYQSQNLTYSFCGRQKYQHDHTNSGAVGMMHRLQLKAIHLWPTFRSSFCTNLHSQSVRLKSFSSSPSSLQYTPWSGLKAWRQSPLNENRFWGSNGPEPLVESSSSGFLFDSRIESASSLAELGALVLSTSDPLAKSRLSHLAYSRWSQEDLPIGVFEAPHRPARPPEPKLVRFLNSGGCLCL